MFDIGFLELAIIFIITLVVVGPDRLPGAVKSGVRFVTKFKRFMAQTKKDIETQIGADEIRRELHNEEVLKSIESFKNVQQELQEQKRALELRLSEDPTKDTDENTFTDPSLDHDAHPDEHHDDMTDHHVGASLDHDADGYIDRYPGESLGYAPDGTLPEPDNADDKQQKIKAAHINNSVDEASEHETNADEKTKK